MKTEIRHPLTELDELVNPAIKKGISPIRYVEVLREVAKDRAPKPRNKANGCIAVLERWLRKQDTTQPFSFSESDLARMSEDLLSGKIRRSDRRKYGSMARQVPVVVRGLHNAAVASCPEVVARPLLNLKTYHRLMRFNRFTSNTKELLLYVEKSGRRSSRNGKSSRPMTQRSRQLAIASTKTLLSKLDRDGVELVTRADIETLLDGANTADSHRIQVRMLHGALPVFRIGIERGVLSENVLDSVSHETFADQAKRDFLPPEEVEKILDLSSVDMLDPDQVRDRLVVLMLYDTAIRRGELSQLEIGDISIDGEKIDVRLRSAVQKGTKPESRLRILFPATRKLLTHYLTHVRCSSPGTALIVNMKGRAATPQVIEAAVKRECDEARLDLRCYGCDRRPTPHAFRRTFATINCAPLGLGMEITALADRLRDSIRVVEESYRLKNPLIQAMNADHYQQASQEEPGPVKARRAIETLQNLGLPARLVQSIQRWEASIGKLAANSESMDQDDDTTWLSEEDVIGSLAKNWRTLPLVRPLREYFRNRNGLRRAGSARGRLSYDQLIVEELVSGYTPVADHVSPQELSHRPIWDLVSDLNPVSVGGVKCVAVADLPKLSQRLCAYRGKVLSRAENC